MTYPFNRRFLKHLRLLALALLVLACVYVLLGRQLPDHAPGWASSLEQSLQDMTGLDVSIHRLEARWQGFSPVFLAYGVRLDALERSDGQPPIELSHLQLSVDVPESLTAGRIRFSSVRVLDLELALGERASGGWGLDGLDGGQLAMDPDELFSLVTRFRDLELRDASVTLNFLNGAQQRLDDLAVHLSSQRGEHRLRADVRAVDSNEPLTLTARLSGRRYEQLAGTVHIRLPSAEHDAWLSDFRFGATRLETLQGAGQAWLTLGNGKLLGADLDLQLDALSLRNPENPELQRQLSVTDLQGLLHLRRDEEAGQWQIASPDLVFRRDAGVWDSGRLHADIGDQGAFRLFAERFDMGMAAALTRDLGVLDELPLAELRTLNPRGRLVNMHLEGRLGEVGLQAVDARFNLDDVRVSARGPAPSVWGVHGYSEMSYRHETGRTQGFVEVDSPDLMLQLPNLFRDIWAYDHINGRVNFRLDTDDGMALRLDSSVITAQSELLTGRAQFSTDYRIAADGERDIDLELLVGALEADVSGKSAYLPMARGALPAAQGVLSWIDDAVLAGRGDGSGFLFRGKVHDGARPQDRSMQMFYRIEDGTLRFDPEWPALEAVDGLVVVDGTEVEVNARAGSSLGIGFHSTRAEVRSNPEGNGRWLTVSGQGSGLAGQGLDYLRQTPVTAGLGAYLAGWETSGDVDFTLDLAIPLFIEGEEPEITLRLGLDDNRVQIPEFALDIEAVNGELLFTGVDGLRSEDLTAQFFGQPVEVSLYNTRADEGLTDTVVAVQGAMDIDSLAQWPLQPEWLATVRPLASGHFAYKAQLELPQQGAEPLRAPTLRVQSDLESLELALPAPLDKPTGQSLPLDLNLLFRETGTELRMRLADVATVNARLDNQQPATGLVFLGPPTDGVTVRRLDANRPGLEVLGRLGQIDLQAWQEAIAELTRLDMPGNSERSLQYSMSRLRGQLTRVDVNVDRLEAYGQSFPALNLRLDEGGAAWVLALQSERLAGSLRVPFTESQPLDVQLDRLHLGDPEAQLPDPELAQRESSGSASPEEEQIRLDELDTVEYVMPREDPLEGVDPRSFPAMQLEIAEFSLDGADYGSWSLRVNPVTAGALFTDLRVRARGLEVGTEAEPARFVWRYDGAAHVSELQGPVVATNIGDVLSAYGFAPNLESRSARFDADLHWQGSPAFFSAVGINGDVDLLLRDGRFLQGTGAANSALKLIGIINFDALVRRLRFSDDLLRQGLAYDEIRGSVVLNQGTIRMDERLQIIGPSSLFQLEGAINLVQERIDGNLYVTLPVSENIPWLSGLAVLNNLINWQVAIGVFVLDRIFGDQVDNLTSAQYRLEGSWDNLEPRLSQVFSTGDRQ